MLKRAVFIITMLFLASGFALSGLIAVAQAVDLPQTGQVTCYDAGGSVTTCPGTGQDGDTLAGVAWPSPRFTDNSDGTVTDNLTGLIWLKDGNCGGTRNWSNALTFANSLYDGWTGDGSGGDCNLSDGSSAGGWRLPNVNELESLINAEETNTATWLNTQGFTNVQSGNHWSSSTYAGSASNAWNVVMWASGLRFDAKTFSLFVWPVRAVTTPPAEIWETGQTTSYATGDDGDLQRGVAWPSPRFTDNGDGTVTDNLTGLIWLQDANCFGTRTWTQALSDANSLASGICGLTDGSTAGEWRLTNRKELHSLTDFSQYNPALPSGHPFSNVQLDFYWSSSTYAGGTSYALDVNMNYGMTSAPSKSDGDYVWPVRGGQPLVSPTPGATDEGITSGSVLRTPKPGDSPGAPAP